MDRQLLKKISAIAILLGVVFVGIGDVFGPQLAVARNPWAPKLISDLAFHFQNVGNFFLIIAPVVLIIADWRNIFPLKSSGQKENKED